MIDMKPVFYVWQRMIIVVSDMTSKKDNIIMSDISRRMDITYAHCYKVLNLLEKMKYVKTHKHSRYRDVMLTARGQEVALWLRQMMKDSLSI